MIHLIASPTRQLLHGGRRLYMVRQEDNLEVELADLFGQAVMIDERQWKVIDVSFREGLGDSGRPREVGLVVEPV